MASHVVPLRRVFSCHDGQYRLDPVSRVLSVLAALFRDVQLVYIDNGAARSDWRQNVSRRSVNADNSQTVHVHATSAITNCRGPWYSRGRNHLLCINLYSYTSETTSRRPHSIAGRLVGNGKVKVNGKDVECPFVSE
jgi:hypothetical protein